MIVEVDITPNDLAALIVDTRFKDIKSKRLMESIIDKVKNTIDIQMEEIEQMQTLIFEKADSDKEQNEAD